MAATDKTTDEPTVEQLAERVDRLEERVAILRFSTVALALSTWILIKKVDDIDGRPWRSEWLEGRVEDLERRLHVHINPKEYTHHDQ